MMFVSWLEKFKEDMKEERRIVENRRMERLEKMAEKRDNILRELVNVIKESVTSRQSHD